MFTRDDLKNLSGLLECARDMYAQRASDPDRDSSDRRYWFHRARLAGELQDKICYALTQQEFPLADEIDELTV